MRDDNKMKEKSSNEQYTNMQQAGAMQQMQANTDALPVQANPNMMPVQANMEAAMPAMNVAPMMPMMCCPYLMNMQCPMMYGQNVMGAGTMNNMMYGGISPAASSNSGLLPASGANGMYNPMQNMGNAGTMPAMGNMPGMGGMPYMNQYYPMSGM
jgi:hypothetical protein